MAKRMRWSWLSVGTLGALAATQAIAAGRAPNNDVYIVTLKESPVVAYAGGIAGYAATKPPRGRKIDPTSPDVVRYADYLRAKHDRLHAQAGGQRKLYSYVHGYNGFAAKLTAAQAADLANDPDVLSIDKDEARTLDTSSTPTFLGLTENEGYWARAKGEGVIIGIIDSGIWPEHPSFSDRTDTNGNATRRGKPGYLQVPGWHGKCSPGEAFTAAACNQKLIGARYYNAAWGGNAGIDQQLPWEYNSPRDFDGHGTHTAGTAAGNSNVQASGEAAMLGTVSGIAPRARISVYKVCWQTPGGGSCFNSDSVAAIDQAVADGVDVINFSISGSQTNFRDPVELAFLFAADAGIFVAASAGNSGPTTSTVAHPGPWLTTVAAGTHNRSGNGSVSLGNGASYSGASVATGIGSAPLIDAAAAGLAGADPSAVALCFAAEDNGDQPVLDPAKVAGKIVVCNRGVTSRLNKSLAVKEAGGIGMILVNTSVNSINADLHHVPTVHLQSTDAAGVKAYAAIAGATASIAAASIVYDEPAPFTASFSSRGPLKAGGGDLLKPDLIAPGQDVLAAVAPPGNGGRLFDLYSGTSMSSPHIAGLAALFKELRPTWSPMAIKSALMTSAQDVLDGPNTNPLVIFRQGAGHVRPNSAMDPGLVFDAGWTDWFSFICATQPSELAACDGYPVSDPSDLNGASIAIGDLAGAQTVRRRVTNVSDSPATYYPSSTGMAGFNVTITPSVLTLPTGGTGEFSVQFLRTSAPLNAYTGGQLTLEDGSHSVRIPMVVRPVALAAPQSVSDAGGPISYEVKFGYEGAFSATARGLVPATISAGSVADDPTDGSCSLSAPNAQLIPVAVPLGTTYARFALFDADVSPGADIDLCVFNSVGTLIGTSGSGTSAEEVNIGSGSLDIGGTTYTVVVHGWGVSGTSPFKLHTWLLGVADAGNMTASAPALAAMGTIGTINLNFNGLTAATKYLGAVSYGGSLGMPSPTIVRVDTP